MIRMWCLATVLFISPVLAHAQTDGEAPTAEELAEEEARALFGAGAAAFEAGRFEDALWSFQRAYDRSHRPQLLFNVAQCFDRLRRDEEAIATFERYLAEMPNPPNRAQVEGRIRTIREAIDRRNAPPVPTPTEVANASQEPTTPAAPRPLSDAPSHRGRRIALISTSAVVVVAATVLTVLLVRGSGDGYSDSAVGVVFAQTGGGR